MRMLTFASVGRVRPARFEERSQLPVKAACVVAGGIRERLATMFGGPVLLHVLEPQIPTAAAWQTIVRAAWVYTVRGAVTDAAIVLRPSDALAIASAAFGEPASVAAERALSTMECEVLERTVAALAGTLGTVCGEMREARVGDAAGTSSFAAYFEVAVDRPLRARIGVAVAREPEPETCGTLCPRDLGAVPLTLTAGIDLGILSAAEASALAAGDVVPIIPPRALRGSLRIGGLRLAAGTCGVRNGRYALEIEGSL